MSTNIGNKIVSDSIGFYVDFANRKCFAPNMLNYSSWTPGSGSVVADPTKYGMTEYIANGQTGENVRVLDVDPFGYANSVVWKSSTVDTTLPSADGGWNTGSFVIDNSKLYRFTVWTKRDAMTVGPTSSGAFYLGHYARQIDGGLTFSKGKVIGNLTNNPYHHITPNPDSSTLASVQPPSLGGLNKWTLVVGHVWPLSSPVQTTLPGTNINGLATNGNHPDSGVWTRDSGKIGNSNNGQDFIWYHPTVRANHRAYHFYAADITATQSFIYPRVDIVDGLEPSITELLAGTEPVRDLSNNMNTIYPFGPTNLDTSGNGLVFSGSEVIGGTLSSTFSVNAVSIWFNPATVLNAASPPYALVQFGSPGLSSPFIIYLGQVTGNLTNEVITVTYTNVKYTAVTNISIPAETWHNLTISWDGTKYLIYLNGVVQSTTFGAGTSDTPFMSSVDYVAIGARKYSGLSDWGALFQGKIGSVIIYERSLDPHEVISNYNAMKQNYGVI